MSKEKNSASTPRHGGTSSPRSASTSRQRHRSSRLSSFFSPPAALEPPLLVLDPCTTNPFSSLCTRIPPGHLRAPSLPSILDSSDVHLAISTKDGLSLTLCVHRNILVVRSGFFTGKLSDRWSNQRWTLPHIGQISDCDNVKVYVDTLRLMCRKDLNRRLMRKVQVPLPEIN